MCIEGDLLVHSALTKLRGDRSQFHKLGTFVALTADDIKSILPSQQTVAFSLRSISFPGWTRKA